jgi:hypothetical protein
MLKLLVSGVVLASLCVPATAQRQGSANRGAPTCTTSIAFAQGGKVDVTYTAITWARGDAMGKLEDAGMRENINRAAAAAPIGSLELSDASTIGGKSIPAGKYDLMFTIDDDAKWHLVLAGGDQKHDWTLDLKDSEHHPRLVLGLVAGQKNDSAMLFIAFGKQHCMLDIGKAAADGAKSDKH